MMMSICPILRDVLPFAFIPADVDQWFRRLVDELREERMKRPLPQEDLFQMLLNSVDKYSKNIRSLLNFVHLYSISFVGTLSEINDVELAGYTLSIFTEGYETSSSVLGFAIYEMARNQDIQERLHEEITDVLAKYDGVCTFEALQEMEYLDNVIHETMRLDVVAPLISKICTKEYTLPLIEGQKEPVTIYPGTPIQICARAVHMLVKSFFEYLIYSRLINFINIMIFRQISGTQIIILSQKCLIQIDSLKKNVENVIKLFTYHLERDQEVSRISLILNNAI